MYFVYLLNDLSNNWLPTPLSLPDTNPNFLKVFITDLSTTVSVNLMYMDLIGNSMNGERMFIDKYLVTVLRLA